MYGSRTRPGNNHVWKADRPSNRIGTSSCPQRRRASTRGVRAARRAGWIPAVPVSSPFAGAPANVAVGTTGVRSRTTVTATTATTAIGPRPVPAGPPGVPR